MVEKLGKLVTMIDGVLRMEGILQHAQAGDFR